MDEKFMLRAVELARRGIGKVNPNPLVGAVIVKDGAIIAEGYHERYGELHAERHALSRLERPEDARGAEMYVTLEPCCHQGKQPPCTQAIIEHGISKVYVGSDDPNELVAGKGIQELRNAGIEVETQVMKETCDALNPVFFYYITKKLPYVVMKYAMTLDGKIACDSGESRWVTGERARAHVHETRNALTGIMVGIGTVLADDPSLTCRIPGGRNPVRIIVDSHLRIPPDSQIVQTAREIPTIVATMAGDGPPQENDSASRRQETESGEIPQKVSDREEKKRILEQMGVTVLAVPAEGSVNEHRSFTRQVCAASSTNIGGSAASDGRSMTASVNLRTLMEILGDRGIDSILLEGGSTLNQSALRAGIVQKLQVYLAPKIFGGSGVFTPVRGRGVDNPSEAFLFHNRRITDFGDDILLEYDMSE